MTERVTAVVLSNGAAIHVRGSREELRTKVEAVSDLGGLFLEVEIEGHSKNPWISATINIMQIGMIMQDHEAKSHEPLSLSGSGEGHAVL